MAKPSANESNILDHKDGLPDRQQAEGFGARLRARAEELGLNSSQIGRLAGIKKQTMIGYFNGERLPGSEKLFSLSDALQVDARYLVTGATHHEARSLVEVGDADWVNVAEYDLREMTDESLGSSILSVPIRLDWLQSTFRATTGLWLTRLLSDYPPADLDEGMLVICRTIRQAELAEGHLCLWRVGGRIVVGRFSIGPDELLARGAVGGLADQLPAGATLAPFVDASLGVPRGDIVVPPSAIAAGRYHLIGRILGVMIRPI